MTPIIAIDGPTASGKGTVAQRVAQQLGFHYLDSGALYRLVGLASQQAGIALTETERLGELARHLPVSFQGSQIFLGQHEVSAAIRTEEMGHRASSVGAITQVRQALVDLQKSFLQPPGLVADGRDMGSVIFPQAQLKVFLTAQAPIRAERRYKQLIAKGISANIGTLTNDLVERDLKDTQRLSSPLVQSADAFLLDTTDKTVEEAVQIVLQWFKNSLKIV